MRLDNSLCNMVVNSVSKQNLDKLSNIDIVIVQCLTYSMCNNLLLSGMIESGAISDTTDKYASSYITTVKSLKEKYTAYSLIKKYIERRNITSLFSANLNDITKISEAYSARKEMLVFDPYDFSPLMYNVSNLDSRFFNRLNQIHTKIMSPIFLFYKKMNDISNVDFVIEDSLVVLDNPGKKIKFQINGINSATVCAHLKLDVIGVRTYLYDITIEDESVLITVK